MTAVTVIPPFSWGSSAIELGNRQWKKRILPVGDVEYQGRTLHFTRSYLSGLVSAWRDGAYDQVPFQLADAANRHTNDPERTRGQITDLELGQDGLYAVLDPTEAGERVLSDNPYLGVSARIVENYQRSDGKFYPAAIQHVLGTLDPRIPQLGSWQPIEMSNGGDYLIDLSGWTWQNEPGPSFELAASAVAARLGAAPQHPVTASRYGDSYELAAQEAALAEFGRAFDLANEIELTRQAEDAVPLPIRAEDRLANALARIGTGTYTPQGYRAYSFASQGGVTGMATCGTSDDLGYCMERFHAPGCGSAATPDITEALREQMQMTALRPLLAEDGQPWPDARFGSPMSATDHVEALTGVRLGDGSLWESHRGHRRELVSAARQPVYGDPDDPDATPQAFQASTRHTAAALAAQSGIQTPADAARQRDAFLRERDRQYAKYRPARHMDYQAGGPRHLGQHLDHASPYRQALELSQFGDEPWNGSLPAYSAGAA